MNLYLRYFDKETLVSNADQAIDFLHSIQDIEVTPELENDVREYAESDVFYPKRYKIRSHVYFIVIKTMAQTMLDFKQKKAVHPAVGRQMSDRNGMGDMVINRLNEVRLGWYEGELDFKRVVVIPSTGKHEYRDTRFIAQWVDNRSQFPSAKGKNFRFKYLGLWK